MLEFVHPDWFWAFFILIPYLLYEIFFKQKRKVRLLHSRVELLKKISGSSWIYNYFPILLRTLVIALLILALARPRLAHKRQQITGKGIDIMLAVDVSGSMQAVDFQPTNRLEAAKEVAKEFINKRRNDRIGMIVFAENAFTQCPLTLDYNILMTIMDNVEINKEANGTAIGMGLATSVARLRESEAKSKVIILITDGRNNAGEIDPLTAADLAATYDIKVYPIGVGSTGLVDFPIQTAFGIQYRKVKIDIDMDTLNDIAEKTGTERALRATNTAELEAIMKHIDEMEKTEIKINDYYVYQEMFWRFLLLAFALLMIEFIFRIVIRKEIP
ncbi:MAG: VWA domain-containing protein [Candidatus Cloacimonetes bacterium]|nr:VWA domain-containing protein [Candidatus Cloacimonadota bacterium]MCF7813575.1 VWA domain-containing protein [Candidatus Cloacimonadota bacterium]MCF7868206.1 VWA domain-containing protein [Candidatus Cloacimonadota bacterium]MCF7883630.1 VWA domain-containing protein [Candidatus Cloacimonadota bacterium]